MDKGEILRLFTFSQICIILYQKFKLRGCYDNMQVKIATTFRSWITKNYTWL